MPDFVLFSKIFLFVSIKKKKYFVFKTLSLDISIFLIEKYFVRNFKINSLMRI